MSAAASPDSAPAAVEKLRLHLRAQYQGIFGEEAIQRHIDEYVGMGNAAEFASFLARRGHVGQRLLDIGAGYGSIVLAARQAGIDAEGLEPAAYEIGFARERLRALRPTDDPAAIYRQGDGMRLPYEDNSFDVVTTLNVLEHVQDFRGVLSEAVRVLKPGGRLYAICPNYAAFRQEAHYLVPWLPLLPRALASVYLRLLGRDPAFFEQHIHYCSNWGVLLATQRLSLRLANPYATRLDDLGSVRRPWLRSLLRQLRRANLLGVVRLALWLRYLNPLKPDITVWATKTTAP
jgi:SAM-dependent methyltransferase